MAKMTKTMRRARMEEEHEALRLELANEFKYFDATNAFRPGALPQMLRKITRYQKLAATLKPARPPVFVPLIEISYRGDLIPPAPIDGDTLHFNSPCA